MEAVLVNLAVLIFGLTVGCIGGIIWEIRDPSGPKGPPRPSAETVMRAWAEKANRDYDRFFATTRRAQNDRR